MMMCGDVGRSLQHAVSELDGETAEALASVGCGPRRRQRIAPQAITLYGGGTVLAMTVVACGISFSFCFQIEADCLAERVTPRRGWWGAPPCPRSASRFNVLWKGKRWLDAQPRALHFLCWQPDDTRPSLYTLVP